MHSDSEKRRFSWRGFRKISAKLPILHALRHVCGIGGHTRTEKCLWRFSLQMHSNGKSCIQPKQRYYNSSQVSYNMDLFEKLGFNSSQVSYNLVLFETFS